MSEMPSDQKTTRRKQCRCNHAVQELFRTANLQQAYVVNNRGQREPYHLKAQLQRLITCVRAFNQNHFVLKELANRRFPKALDLNLLCQYSKELSGHQISFEVVRYVKEAVTENKRSVA